MNQIIEDASKLSKISKKDLDNYHELLEDIIAHRITEDALDNPSASSYTIELPYLGTLIIKSNSNSYELIPSDKFKSKVSEAEVGNSSLYKKKLAKLISIIVKNYDEL